MVPSCRRSPTGVRMPTGAPRSRPGKMLPMTTRRRLANVRASAPATTTCLAKPAGPAAEAHVREELADPRLDAPPLGELLLPFEQGLRVASETDQHLAEIEGFPAGEILRRPDRAHGALDRDGW